MRPSLALRFGALISFGALAVHQGRYALAYGDDAEHALATQGHGYLALAGPLIAMLLALAGGRFIAHLAGAAARTAQARHSRRRILWAAFSSALVGVYITQELTEGVLASGHPAGLAGLFGDGGWLAIVLAAVVGAFLALVAGSAERALARRAGALIHFAWRVPGLQRLTAAPAPPVRHPLALRIAARGPPSSSA